MGLVFRGRILGRGLGLGLALGMGLGLRLEMVMGMGLGTGHLRLHRVRVRGLEVLVRAPVLDLERVLGLRAWMGMGVRAI